MEKEREWKVERLNGSVTKRKEGMQQMTVGLGLERKYENNVLLY